MCIEIVQVLVVSRGVSEA